MNNEPKRPIDPTDLIGIELEARALRAKASRDAVLALRGWISARLEARGTARDRTRAASRGTARTVRA